VTSSSTSQPEGGSASTGGPLQPPARSRQQHLSLVEVGLWFLPVLVIALLIGAWQAATIAFGWQSFFVPSPVEVVQALGQNRGIIFSNAVPTIEEAAGGFAMGSVAAVTMAIMFVHVRAIKISFYPLAIGIQSIPIVSIAPVLVTLLGQGYESKIVLAALITFFPTLVSTVQGLEAVEPSLIDLFRSVHASWWKILWKLRMPNAVPYMFLAFRITATLSVIGAVIAEWLGAPKGLGYLIIAYTFDFRIPQLWATNAVSALLALGAFVLVALVQRLVVPWQPGVARSPRSGRRRRTLGNPAGRIGLR
jgi:NitT/TauT family transport system permease protein